jgi:hypothetical protein
MKHVFLFFLIITFFSACIPDHCKDTVCNNGGVCVEGNCSCLNGYEGINCTEVWNTRFLSTWQAIDVVNGDTAAYVASLIDNGRPDQFLIMNLSGEFDSVLCRRTSYYGFALRESQEIDTVMSIRSGSGAIDSLGKSISFSYHLDFEDSSVLHQITLLK